jgi:hypothetical protein
MLKTASFVIGLVVGGVLLAGAVALGLLNLGRQGPPTALAKPPLQCKDPAGPCQVAVSVDCSATPCTLSVDAEYIIVNTNKAPIQLTWQLQNSSYAFTDNGIVFPAGADIENCHKEGSGQRFRCLDKNPKFDVYKYTINVTGPNQVTALDPWVVND